jgi:hypothetical protein
MPNQDLLYSILPRAPITPGSGEVHREITRIEKEPVTKKTEVHKDPAEHSSRDEYYPSHEKQEQDEEPEHEATPNPVSHKDGDDHIDLFV